MNIRVGFGFDVHQLKDQLDFWLGGVKLDHEKGAFGHSDADALLHAITDAILGAAALGDIGQHFPDTDPQYKGISSIKLLELTVELLKSKGFSVGNVDCTVCLERPKLSPYAGEMRANVARVLEVDLDAVSIKATTSEKMGFVGREEGIAVYAVALLYSS